MAQIDIAAALRDGYSPTEILDGMHSSNLLGIDLNAAREDGYTDDEILSGIFVPAAEAPKAAEGGIVTDTGHLLKIGADQAALNIRGLVKKIPGVGEPFVSAMDKVDEVITGKPSDQLLESDIAGQQKKLTAPMQDAQSKQWWDSETKSFGPAISDPRSWYSGVVQSLPETALTMIPALRMAKATGATATAKALATGATAAEAAAAGAKAASIAAYSTGAIVEGSMGGAASEREVAGEIMKMPEDVLNSSEAYNQLLEQGLSAADARKQLAEDVGTKAFILGGVATGIFSGAGDVFLSKAIRGEISGGLATRMAKGAVSEGLLEEGPQGYLQKMGQNYALQDADKTQGLTEGALNESIGGIAAGGVMGAGFGIPNGAQPKPQPAKILGAETTDEAIQIFADVVAVEPDAASQFVTDNIPADELLVEPVTAQDDVLPPSEQPAPSFNPATAAPVETNAILSTIQPQSDLRGSVPVESKIRPAAGVGGGTVVEPVRPAAVDDQLATAQAQRNGDAAGIDASLPGGSNAAVDAGRRTNAGLRQQFDAMTPEERAVALEDLHRKAYVSDMTGLPNKRAFDEQVTANPGAKVLYGDVDGLKALNTRYGHNGADQILKAVGEVKAAVAGEMGVNAFHRSGDEFLAIHPDQNILNAYGAEVQKRLDSATVEVTLPDGSVERHTGIGLSYGVGENADTAEARAETQKAERKSGAVPIQAAGGNQNQQSGLSEAAKNLVTPVSKSEVTAEKPAVIAAKPAETAQSEKLAANSAPVFGTNSAGNITLRGVPRETIQAVRDKLKLKGVIVGNDSAVFPKGTDLKALQAEFGIVAEKQQPKAKPEPIPEEERARRAPILKNAKALGIKTVARPFSEIEKDVLAASEAEHSAAVDELSDDEYQQLDDAATELMDKIAGSDEKAQADLQATIEQLQKKYRGREYYEALTNHLEGLQNETKPEETGRTESGAGDNQEAGRNEAKPAAEQVDESSTAQAGNVKQETRSIWDAGANKAIKLAREEQDGLNEFDLAKEVKSIEANGNVDLESAFENPEFWDAENEQFTDAGLKEVDRLTLEKARDNLRLLEISQLSDLDIADHKAQYAAMKALLDGAGIEYTDTSSSQSKYLEVLGMKLRFADHANMVRDSAVRGSLPIVNIAPGETTFSEALYRIEEATKPDSKSLSTPQSKKLEVLRAQAQGKITGDQGAALKELADAGEHAAVDEVLKPAQENDGYTIASHADMEARVREGTMSAAEFKASFEALLKNKAGIVAELDKFTKPQLFEKYPGLAYRYKNEKKADGIDAVYRDMLHDYTLGESLVYGMGRNAMEESLRAMVERTTDESLAKFAENVKQNKADRESARAEAMAGMENPETLEDYQRLMSAKAKEMGEGVTFQQVRMSLTQAQRTQFDELAAVFNRGERAKKKVAQQEQSLRAPGEAVETTEIIKTKHTKHGHDLWQFQMVQRVSPEEFKSLATQAKRLGGDYSSYRGNGAIPGWQFRTEEAAKAFKALVAGDTEQAKGVMDARRDAYADDRSQTAVERLTEMADALDEKADASLNQERKSNTARRARFAASAEASANSDKAMAQTMRNIASGIENGTAKLLDRVRQKVQVEALQGFVRTAFQEQFQKYADQEKNQPSVETADYAKYPSYTAYRSDLASLGRSLLEVEGTMKLGQRLMKVADDVTEAYLTFAKENLLKVSTFSTKDGARAAFPNKASAEASIARSGFKGSAIVLPVKRNENLIILSPSEAIKRGIWEGDNDKRISLSPDFGEELVEKIGKVARRGAKVSVPWQLENAYDSRKRLAGMNIETPAELRAALREFIGLRETAKEPDKIKQMERAMIGRKNDGFDFFPTPAIASDDAIAAADIKEGMTIYEPQAGMGHIADRIREAGFEPDVGEIATDRRELLEAKGYNVVSRDFMDMHMEDTPNGEGYDRIIMNPPFSDRRDAMHVRHAYSLLKPGGRLVSIMGEGVFFGQDKKAESFREWLDKVGGTEEKLEQGTFLDPSLPVNTGVSARMVVIDKSETDKGTALFSQSQSKARNPYTKETLRAAIDSAMGKNFSGMLEATEKFKIIESGEIAEYLKGEATFSKADQTDTPEFKKWFGDSKVVDADGRPLIVYHGTQADFTEFDTKKMYSGEGATQSGSGFYFTTKADSASNYAKMKGDEGSKVLPVYLSIKKPLHIDFRDGEVFGAEHEFTRSDVKKILMLAPDIKSKEDSPLMNFGDIAYEGFDKVLNEAIDAYAGSNNFAALRNDFFGDNHQAWLGALNKVLGYDGAYSKLDDGTIHYVAWKPEQIKSAIGNSGAFDPKNPDIRYSKDGRILAFVTGGNTYFVADSIGADDSVKGLLTHELGVHALQLGRTDEEFQSILNRIETMRKMGDKRVKAAFARVPSDTPAHLVSEEAAGYLAESNPDMPIIQKLIARFRALLRSIGKSLPVLQRAKWFQWAAELSVDDILLMAQDATKRAPQDLNAAAERGEFKSSEQRAESFARLALEELAAENDALFSHKKSVSKTLTGVIDDVVEESEYLGDLTREDENAESGADHRYAFKTKNDKLFYVYENDNGEVWIDVSRLDQGSGGAAIYAAVGNYAYNAGKRFIGDPNGLSPEAVVRRTHHMLSSALRFGTTKHLDAAKQQALGAPEDGVTPLDWKGSEIDKVEAMVHTIVETSEAMAPSLKEYHYDFQKSQFSDAQGQPVTGAAMAANTPRNAGIGEKTARRVVLLRSLLDADRAGGSGGRSGILEKLLSYDNSSLPESMRRLFSRRAEGDVDSGNRSGGSGQKPLDLQGGLPSETKTETARRIGQDAMLRFRVIQDWLKEQGVKLSEAADVYARENLSKATTANKIEDFRNFEIEPLIQKIAKAGIDLNDITDYLQALHIPEANARMRKIHNDPDATANGITDDEAMQAKADFEAMPNFSQFKELADEVQRIGSQTLEMRYAEGLVSKEQYDAYKATYSHWIPLRGNMPKQQGFGRGMSTNAKQKRRFGHEQRDEFIFENLVSDRERAIFQVEHNKMGRAVANFILEAKNEDIGTISKPERQSVLKDNSFAVSYNGQVLSAFNTKQEAQNYVLKTVSSKSGAIQGLALNAGDFDIEKTNDPHVAMMVKPMLAENEIQVYINGHAVRLQLNDPLLARAATNSGIEQLAGIMYIARQINGFLSKAYTAWSPDFLFVNPVRDLYQGSVVLTGKEGIGFSGKAMKNYAWAWKELWDAHNDTRKSEWVTRYRKAGGNTGGAYLSDIERVGQETAAALQEFMGWKKTFDSVQEAALKDGKSPGVARTKAALKAGLAGGKKIPALGHFLRLMERLNGVFENTLRLATFKAAIDSGKTDQQAAMLAKDLMNFNRKGEIANQMGAAYLFFNPAIQGSHVVLQSMISQPHSKQARWLVGGLMMSAFLLAEAGRGGDDDDERDWQNIPDYVKARNLVLKFGDTQVTIPVAYGFGVFHSLGNAMSDLLHGVDSDKVSLHMATSVFENFSVFGNPLIEQDGKVEFHPEQLLPTVPKMVTAPSTNMDSLGRPIQPRKFKASTPDSQNMTRAARGTLYADVAASLNDWTGGNEYQAGMIDVSPNTLKYWVQSLTGGAGRFMGDTFNAASGGMRGVAPELANIPIARKFVRESDVADSRQAFWQVASKAKLASEAYRTALKDGDRSAAAEMKNENLPYIQLAKMATHFSELAGAKRNEIEKINASDLPLAEKKEKIRALENAELEIYNKFLSVFDKKKMP